MENITLDITKEHCPMTFVKTKLALEKLKKGNRLTVLLSKGEPLDNVPKTVKEQGSKILEISKVEGLIHKIVIEK